MRKPCENSFLRQVSNKTILRQQTRRILNNNGRDLNNLGCTSFDNCLYHNPSPDNLKRQLYIDNLIFRSGWIITHGNSLDEPIQADNTQL